MLISLHWLRLWNQSKPGWRDLRGHLRSLPPSMTCTQKQKSNCILWLAKEKRDREESVWSCLLCGERSRKLRWAWICCFSNHHNMEEDRVHSWSFCRKCFTLVVISSTLTPSAQTHWMGTILDRFSHVVYNSKKNNNKAQGVIRNSAFFFSPDLCQNILKASTFKAALKKESACMATDFAAIINSSQ